MKEEIKSGAKFLAKVINRDKDIEEYKCKNFAKILENILLRRYKDHWYINDPQRGQGYRCIRINGYSLREPIIGEAAALASIPYSRLTLPMELTVWIDPNEVSCRFGEAEGTPCTLATFVNGIEQSCVDSVDVEQMQDAVQQTANQELMMVEVENMKKKVVSTTFHSRKKSIKENIAPKSTTLTNSKSIRDYQTNGVLKPLANKSQVYNSPKIRPTSEAGSAQYVNHLYSSNNCASNLYMYSHAGDGMPPYYKNVPWGCHLPLQQSRSMYNSNPAFNFAQYSDNFNNSETRTSPSTISNKVRWNSGPSLNGFERHGWIYNHPQLSRV